MKIKGFNMFRLTWKSDKNQIYIYIFHGGNNLAQRVSLYICVSVLLYCDVVLFVTAVM